MKIDPRAIAGSSAKLCKKITVSQVRLVLRAGAEVLGALAALIAVLQALKLWS